MAKKRKKRTLESIAEAFAVSLIYQASGGSIGRKGTAGEEDKENPISFKDRRALLDSVTKLLGAQTPQEDDSESGLNSFRERLRDGDSRTSDGGGDTDASNDQS